MISGRTGWSTKHFPSDFYVTCATVIPVLFLAYAVQGRVYGSLLRASLLEMRASLPSAKVDSWRWRRALAGPLLLRFGAYAIVLAGFMVRPTRSWPCTRVQSSQGSGKL